MIDARNLSNFARGIADVRLLCQWMPLWLIFLIVALTMRQWSEEQRSGAGAGRLSGGRAARGGLQHDRFARLIAHR